MKPSTLLGRSLRRLPLLSLPLLSLPLTGAAITLPAGFTDSVVASGLASPTAMAVAPDGRVFVLTQAGGVRVVQGGALLPAPALSLAVDSRGERGLIGIALAPDFASSGHVYLHYTVLGSGGAASFNRVARYTMTGNTIDPASQLVLQDLNPLSGATNHNGGALRFGADGQLYIAVGDNNDGANAQNLGNKLGKILRVDPATGAPSAGNPFLGVAGASAEVWAYGLRNPFQTAFSPDDGRFLINDVGQNTFEEINLGVAGGNYGWPAEEGANPGPGLDPVYQYGHGAGGGCAISGGSFYGAANQAFGAGYQGDYFFADYCNGWIRSLDPLTGVATGFASDAGFGIVDLAVSTDGGLYHLRRGGGTLALITGPVANIPEPAPAAMLLAGVVVLALRRRWQR